MFFSVKVTDQTRVGRKIVTPQSPLVNQMVASQLRIRLCRIAGRRFAVLDRTGSDVSGRVAALVRALLAKRSIDRSVGCDDDLGESGLSSLDLVNLMLAVEAEFDLKIPDRDMRPANFRSIARIEALIAGLVRASEPIGGE